MMKKFLLKTSLFVGVPLLIAALISLAFKSRLEDHPLDYKVLSKMKSLPLKKGKKNIVIAGDSRAKRQLIPEIITAKTGVYSVNAGTDSGDLITVSNTLGHYDSIDADITYVISAGSWQINDGALDKGYLSLKCFQQFTFPEKVQLFFTNSSEWFRLEKLLFKRSLKFVRGNLPSQQKTLKVPEHLGFKPVDDTLNLPLEELDRISRSHPWYKDPNQNNARLRVFKKALEKLAARKEQVIIYHAPVAPVWKSFTRETEIDKAEKNFGKVLKQLCENYDNLHFYDFYEEMNPGFDDNAFYDMQHLNREGAKVFSEKTAEILMERGGL